MDAKSPISGNTGQTLLAVMSTAADNKTSDRLLSWTFTENVNFPIGVGYQTSDSKTVLPMDVSHTPGWHRYGGRWQGTSVNYGDGDKTTHKDGKLVATGNSDHATLVFKYSDVVNIGWFRWWSPVFNGDVRELIVFSGALSDGDLQRFDESEEHWLS
jgi:hypothetical protein